jgi:hypothetical protein
VRLMPLIGRDPHRFGRNADIDLVQILKWETPVHVRVDVRPYLDTKSRASACHRSQAGPSESFRGLPAFVVRRMFGFETFIQGYPTPAAGSAIGRELFAAR